MVFIIAVAVGGLILLAALSVYSALKLAKRTDEIVAGIADDENLTPMAVRFPEKVFSKTLTQQTARK
ncbi:MAG: hypothetical protein M1133_10505 [Armatimonadetes bacterium]|nr:hypothetical protein [Armatimonadota bacterium]